LLKTKANLTNAFFFTFNLLFHLSSGLYLSRMDI
jgi:hypothetical protein